MNPYALIWSVTCGAGIVLSLVLILGVLADLRSMGRIANGRRTRARWRLASEAFRLAIHVGFLRIGLLALDSPSQFSDTLLTLLLGNVGLIFMSLISVKIDRIRPSVEAIAETAAQDLVLQAAAAAELIEEAAEKAAAKLRRVQVDDALERTTDAAERTADDQKRSADASERTAEAAERTAENTDPANGAS